MKPFLQVILKKECISYIKYFFLGASLGILLSLRLTKAQLISMHSLVTLELRNYTIWSI